MTTNRFIIIVIEYIIIMTIVFTYILFYYARGRAGRRGGGEARRLQGAPRIEMDTKTRLCLLPRCTEVRAPMHRAPACAYVCYGVPGSALQARPHAPDSTARWRVYITSGAMEVIYARTWYDPKPSILITTDRLPGREAHCHHESRSGTRCSLVT